MLLIVPFTVRNPETEAAVREALRSSRSGCSAVWEDVSGHSDAYWRVLCRRWYPGEDLIVIEHDVVIRPDVLEQFEACPEPWCSFGYSDMCHEACREAWANQLGCTRFRAELIAECPDAVSSISAAERDWHNLCDSIAGDKVGGNPAPLRPKSVRASGFSHHWHRPYVDHHPWGIEENDRRHGR